MYQPIQRRTSPTAGSNPTAKPKQFRLLADQRVSLQTAPFGIEKMTQRSSFSAGQCSALQFLCFQTRPSQALAHQIGDGAKVTAIMVCDFPLGSPRTCWLRNRDLRLMGIHELLFGGEWAEPGFTRDRRQESPKRRNGFGAAVSRAVPERLNQVTVHGRGPAAGRVWSNENNWGPRGKRQVTPRNDGKQGEKCDYSCDYSMGELS
jgi:hypothetical protein